MVHEIHCIGLDVHADSISIAIAEAGRDGGTSGFTGKSRTTSTWWTRSFEFDTKLAPAALFWLGILLARSWNAAWSHRRDALALAGLHRAGYEAF
jgi:hypothetical protein